MLPALDWLQANAAQFGRPSAGLYYWGSGVLSSLLDNAPTYLSFASAALGALSPPGGETIGVHELLADPLGNRLLIAISIASVFFGANTYIGNGPNFMVKAIAEEDGYRMPSFFGYMLYSGLILLPIFGLVTYLFFRP